MSGIAALFSNIYTAAITIIGIIFAGWVGGIILSSLYDATRNIAPETPEARNAIDTVENLDNMQGTFDDAVQIRKNILPVLIAIGAVTGTSFGAFFKTGEGKALLLLLIIIPLLFLL